LNENFNTCGLYASIRLEFWPNDPEADEDCEARAELPAEFTLEYRRMLRYSASTRTWSNVHVLMHSLHRQRRSDGELLVQVMGPRLEKFLLQAPPQCKYMDYGGGWKEWYSFELRIRHTDGETEAYWCHNFTECYMTAIDCVHMYRDKKKPLTDKGATLTFQAEEWHYDEDERAHVWQWERADYI
jgi:hypothetical protein